MSDEVQKKKKKSSVLDVCEGSFMWSQIKQDFPVTWAFSLCLWTLYVLNCIFKRNVVTLRDNQWTNRICWSLLLTQVKLCAFQTFPTSTQYDTKASVKRSAAAKSKSVHARTLRDRHVQRSFILTLLFWTLVLIVWLYNLVLTWLTLSYLL